MKRYSLLLIIIFVIVQSADAQWFYRQFGVHSLNQMNKTQLDMSLRFLQAKRNKTVVAYSVIIPASAATGALLIHKANRADHDEGSGMAAAVGGTVLLITAGLIPAAAAEITVQSIRISKVKKALGNPVFHPDISYYLQPGSNCAPGYPVCSLSVSFSF